MNVELAHIPVAVERCFDLLSPSLIAKNKPFLLDSTLGLGGHANYFLQRIHNLHLIGIDRDLAAIKVAKTKLESFANRTTFVHATFDQIKPALSQAGVDSIDGVLFDLGVSSMQLDEKNRGFSYSQPAQLDMRMDQSASITAQTILDTYSHGQLAKILQNYGEEKFASKIAENIIKARGAGGLTNTSELAQIVKDSIPAPARRTGGNPAKRTFQAIRIEVNQELSLLERAIPAALAHLNIGARLVVMSYQSLEDRIVKTFFSDACKSKTPLGLPMDLPNSAASYKLLINGSQAADDLEQLSNPRSQSMRLRAIQRVGE